MAWHRETHLTIVVPNGRDEEPTDREAAGIALAQIEETYGYVPPLLATEVHGWSAQWHTHGRATPGWKYVVVVGAHLGPARPASAEDVHRPGSHPAERRSPMHPAGRNLRRERPRTPAPA